MSSVDSILDGFVKSVVPKAAGRDFFLEKLRIRQAYKAIFSTPDGKLVLRDIVQHSHVGKSTYVKGDPDLMLIREGERRLALSILRCSCVDLQTTLEETYYGE